MDVSPGEYSLVAAAVAILAKGLVDVARDRKNGKAPLRVEIEPTQMQEFRGHFQETHDAAQETSEVKAHLAKVDCPLRRG